MACPFIDCFVCSLIHSLVHCSFVRSGEVSFEWQTENVNVIPKSYKKQSGKVTLADGQMQGSVHVELVDNDTWSVESTMQVPYAIFVGHFLTSNNESTSSPDKNRPGGGL